MRDDLLKAMQYGTTVDVMYMAKDGKITKRRIKVLKLSSESFQAFCFTRHAKRTFLIYSVLALFPEVKRERTVV